MGSAAAVISSCPVGRNRHGVDGVGVRSELFVLVGLGLLAWGCSVGDGATREGPMLGASTTGSTTPVSGDGTSPDATTGPGPGGSGVQTTADGGSTSSGPGPLQTTTAGCSEPTAWYPDEDEDGFGDMAGRVLACDAPAGHVGDGTDCDDEDDAVFPGAQETCGGADTNCDFVPPVLCNSCLQQLASGNTSGDGLYTIDPDGDDPLPPTQVWCDMTIDGGGWTLVQRTVWDPAQTSALRTGYADWYTLTIGNPSPNQGFRLQGSAWGHLNIQLDHMLRHDLRRESDGGSCSPLYYIGTGGTLTVTDTATGLTGLVADVNMINDTNLSTLDSGPSSNCVDQGTAVPWFFGACCSTCPTYQGSYWLEPHPMESYSQGIPDAFGSTELDVCSSPAQPAMTGSFVGVNAMEYYLR